LPAWAQSVFLSMKNMTTAQFALAVYVIFLIVIVWAFFDVSALE
jgi:hypothetical protein